MADTTLNKRIADLAKKLGVSPLDLKNDLVGQMSVVKKEFGDGYEPTSNIDLAKEIGKSLQARGPEYYKLFRDHYDAENPDKPFSRVIEPFNTVLSGMADHGLEGDAKEKYANPFGYEKDPNGEGFSVPSDRDEAFIEEFEEETGDAATPDRPKPKPKKTLEQPEGGAAPAPGGMAMTPANQTQAATQAKANSMPKNVALGTGGATTGNRAQMNMQAEADRQAANIIRQNKINERKKATLDLEDDTMSDKGDQYRNLYDTSGDREAGAWDALDSDQQKQMFRNYNLNRSAGAPTPENSTPRPRNIDEYDAMTPEQQKQLVQNGGTQPGQPETIQEGTVGSALEASNPMDSLETVTVPQGQREGPGYQTLPGKPPTPGEGPGYQILTPSKPFSMDDFDIDEDGNVIDNRPKERPQPSPRPYGEGDFSIGEDGNIVDNRPKGGVQRYEASNQTVPGQYTPPERVYPAPDSATEGDRGGIDVSEIFKQNPALQMDGEGNMLPPTDGPGDDVTKYTPPDVSNMPPIEDVFADLPEAPARPEAPYSPPDVSNMRPIEDVFNDLPQAPGRPQPQRAPAPAPIAKAPQPQPPPQPQPKAQGHSPVYGKKPDGTMGILGYRNNAEMQKGMGGQRIKKWTPQDNTNFLNNQYERQVKEGLSRAEKLNGGSLENPFNPGYNRAGGAANEDAFAKRRAQQAELAKKAARQRELAAMPTPRADAGMDLMNSLPMNQQVGIVNQFRKKRGEQDIFNPYSA